MPGTAHISYLIILLTLFAAALGRGGEDHALVVGISRYPPGVNPLPACEQDAARFRDLLSRPLGFPPGNIRLLQGAVPGAELKAALEAEAGKCVAGDSFVFYYSGHGTQVKDLDGDESDGLDEVLVGSDLNLLSDDEIGQVVKSLLEKKIRAALVFDSCFSGDGYKALSLDPGRQAKFIPSSLLAAKGHAVGGGAAREPALRGLARASKELAGVSSGALDGAAQGDFVFMSAASEFEVAQVMNERASAYTQFLLDGLAANTPADANQDGKVTFQEAHLFARQQLRLSGFLQRPTLVAGGQGLAQDQTLVPRLFGGTATQPAPQPPEPRRDADIDSNLDRAVARLVSRMGAGLAVERWAFGFKMTSANEPKLGELLTFEATPSQDGYLVVVNVGASGTVTLLYPNKFHLDFAVKRGQTIRIPSGEDDSYRIRAGKPAGNEFVVAFLLESDPFKDLDLAASFKGLAGPFLGKNAKSLDLLRRSPFDAANIKAALLHRPLSIKDLEVVSSTGGAGGEQFDVAPGQAWNAVAVPFTTRE